MKETARELAFLTYVVASTMKSSNQGTLYKGETRNFMLLMVTNILKLKITS